MIFGEQERTQPIGSPVRRLVLGTTVLLAGALLGAQAQAGTIVPMHQRTESKTIHEPVRSVTVTGDYSSIRVLTGTTTRVTAEEAWNFEQPKLTVTVNRGALKIDISCTNTVSAGGVAFVGYGDLVNDCTDDLTVTMPADAVLTATTGGPISTSGLHAAQQLHSYNDKISVAKATGSVEASSGSGDVSATQLRAAVVNLSSASGGVHATEVSATHVTLHSGQGAVQATRIRATDVSLSSDSGDVTAAAVTASALTLHSGQGDLATSDTTARSTALTTDSGNITFAQARTRSLVATSGQGSIQGQHVTARTATLRSSSGNLTVDDVVSTAMEMTSGQGAVTTRALKVTDLTATTSSGNIRAETTNAPHELLLRSGQGIVAADVVAGTYAVTASTGQGQVTITGVTVDSAATHHIDAHSDSGDVTIQGHEQPSS